MLRDIALGLKELHEKDMVHLDLKLENILVGSTGKYKLGDLGLSRLIKKLKNNLPEGDIRYLALEKLNADQDPTPIDHKKCDIFSLGIIAFELMEGKRTQQRGAQWHDLREDRISFTDPDKFSARTKKMVVEMLNSDPSKRPTVQYLLDTYLLSKEEKELRLLKKL